MGLAGPRKRVKLSHDPNNTTWTRDTTGFGHKIMTSQGWQPGEYLGAKNAPHAEFHTAANASFIRVLAKDDNLGIGAKRGSGVGEGECTGLDVFQNLLGRLNGRDEDELEREQKSREDLKRAIYTERRWGSIRFVKGGFLIGDKIQDLIEGEAERVKQLREHGEAGSQSLSQTSDDSEISEDAETRRRREKIEKRERKEKRRAERESRREARNLAEGRPTVDTVSISAKEEKHKKKQQQLDLVADESAVKSSRKGKKEMAPAIEVVTQKAKSGSKKKKSKTSTPDVDQDPAAVSLPMESLKLIKEDDKPATQHVPPALLSGRHAVRSRFIAQKRLAVMDTASLNQIFMIKQ